MAGIIAASVRSPYNFVFAGAILLYLTRFSSDGHSTTRQLLRYLAILAITWALGSLSDLIFPNSIPWTILPCALCATLIRDWPVPTRLARTSLLVCAWIYSLAIAEAVNVQMHGGIWLAALASLLYAVFIWCTIELLERSFKVASTDITLLNIIPVLIVCAVGIAFGYRRRALLGPYAGEPAQLPFRSGRRACGVCLCAAACP